VSFGSLIFRTLQNISGTQSICITQFSRFLETVGLPFPVIRRVTPFSLSAQNPDVVWVVVETEKRRAGTSPQRYHNFELSTSTTTFMVSFLPAVKVTIPSKNIAQEIGRGMSSQLPQSNQEPSHSRGGAADR